MFSREMIDRAESAQEARTAPPLRNVPQPPPTPSESLTRALSVPSYPQTQESLSDQLRALRVAAVKMGLYDADDWLMRRDV